MDVDEARARLEALLAQAPKPEEFEDQEAYQEAKAGFLHRAGPSIRCLRSLANLTAPSSQVTAK